MIGTIAGIIIVAIAGSILCVSVYNWFGDCCELKKKVERSDNFEKLMRKQLELDAERLRAYEDMLREACRSQMEEEFEDGYEED